MASPNTEYHSLDHAFGFFKRGLFVVPLPDVLITLHKHPRARGYCRRRAFAHRGEAGSYIDEICLCPNTHPGRSDRDILSTLVHEMVHLWQYHFGRPSRTGYHNREWADQMIKVGLMPSSTGEPGGSQTGQRMTHFVLPGGPFDVACRELLASGWRLQWEEREGPAEAHRPTRPVRTATRRKFTCPWCGLAAYSRPGAFLVCGSCPSVMS